MKQKENDKIRLVSQNYMGSIFLSKEPIKNSLIAFLKLKHPEINFTDIQIKDFSDLIKIQILIFTESKSFLKSEIIKQIQTDVSTELINQFKIPVLSVTIIQDLKKEESSNVA